MKKLLACLLMFFSAAAFSATPPTYPRLVVEEDSDALLVVQRAKPGSTLWVIFHLVEPMGNALDSQIRTDLGKLLQVRMEMACVESKVKCVFRTIPFTDVRRHVPGALNIYGVDAEFARKQSEGKS